MKNKFIKSAFILMVGGIITKILSFVIKIYFTRIIGIEGINIYSIIMPTYSLLITITQLGFPIAIASLVAKGEKRGINIMFSIVPLALLINLILILGVIFSAEYLSVHLLHEKDAYYPLIAMSFVLPFISIASIIRGYFFGKQKMMPHSLSNVIEQLFKLFVVLLILPKLLTYGTVIAVSGYVLISILSETISIIVFLLYLPKKFIIKKEDLKPDLETVKEVLSIGLPNVGSRIIGNIGYFFEPIILAWILLYSGFTSSYIISEYAIYNTFVMGVLIVPTFLIMGLSTSLVPEIAKHSHNLKKVKRIYHKVLGFSLLLGILANTVIFFFAKEILLIVFHTTKGVIYIKILAFFFTLYYLEGPMGSVLQALNASKSIIKTTTIAMIIKLIFIVIFGYFKLGIYALIFAEIINIIIVIILRHKDVQKLFKNNYC